MNFTSRGSLKCYLIFSVTQSLVFSMRKRAKVRNVNRYSHETTFVLLRVLPSLGHRSLVFTSVCVLKVTTNLDSSVGLAVFQSDWGLPLEKHHLSGEEKSQSCYLLKACIWIKDIIHLYIYINLLCLLSI